MIETAIIIASISLAGTITNGLISLFSKVKRSKCGIFSCEQGNNNINIDLDSSGRVQHIDIPQSDSE